jgi:TolB protein
MRYVYVSLLALAVCGCQSSRKKSYDYCYATGHGLYVGNYGHDPVHVYVNGTDACLCPDGTEIAYTDMGAPDRVRRIGIFDLEAGKVRLMDTGCHNCYGPVWSPDGQYLVYNAMIGNQRGIKCVDRDNLHALSVAVAGDSLQGFFSPTWSADSRNIAVQNMSGVYVYDLDGRVVRSIPFAQFDTSVQFSSESTFMLTEKGDKLVFWAGDGSAVFGKADAPAAVFVYDLTTARTDRLSPKGYDCWRPVIKGDTIFCRGRHGNSLKENTYRMDMDGGHFKLAYKDKIDISFAQR